MTDTTPDTGPRRPRRFWLATVERPDGTLYREVPLWGHEDGPLFPCRVPDLGGEAVDLDTVVELVPAVVQPETTPDTADEVERLAEIAYETQRQAWLPTLRINRWAEQSDSLRESWRKGIRAVLAARRSAGEA